MDFELSDEQKLIRETAREFTDKEIVFQSRENARNHHFDLDLVEEDRRPGLPRRDRACRVRRRRPRLPLLRPDRRGDRPRRLGDPHGHLRADLARLLGHPQVGHRGAEAQVPAEALLRRVARLLRADRARHGLRRGEPEDAREEGRRRLGDQRREDVDLDGELREGRADLRADRPRARPQRASRASSSTPTSPASKRRRSSTRWACTPPTRRRSHSKTSRSPTTTCSARSARASKSRCRTSTRAATRSPPAASASARAASRSRSGTRRSANSSAARSRASSSCRR